MRPKVLHQPYRDGADALKHAVLGHKSFIIGVHNRMFVQTTSVSALNLHVIMVLCYATIEAYAWLEFGKEAYLKGGTTQQHVSHVLLVLLLGSLLPFAAGVIGELQSRKAFLHR